LLDKGPTAQAEIDTVVVPAQDDGFINVFIAQRCWYSLKLSKAKMKKLRFIAIYRVHPTSAITHYAQISHFEPHEGGPKYKVLFQGEAKEIKRVPFGSAPSGAMQGIRYTTLAEIISATTIADIIRPKPKPTSRKIASGWRHLLRA
jgi:hypothetical protein